MLADQPRARSLVSGADSLIALFIAIAASSIANRHRLPSGDVGAFLVIRLTASNAAFCVAFGVLWHKCSSLSGIYEERFRSLAELVASVVRACTIMTGVFALYLIALHRGGPVLKTLGLFFLLTVTYECTRLTIDNLRLRDLMRHPEKAIIIGTGRRAQKAWRELRVHHHKTVELLGFVDVPRSGAVAPDIESRQLCTVDQLKDYLHANAVDTLIIAVPLQSCFPMARDAVKLAENLGVRIVCMQDLFSLTHRQQRHKRVQTFVELEPRDDLRAFCLLLKSVLDRCLAAIALVALLPLIGMIAALSRTLLGESVFLGRTICGYRRRPFVLWSFRTLKSSIGPASSNASPRPRLRDSALDTMKRRGAAGFGKLLRSTRLENLPRLWNVVTGEMSLFGPRPSRRSLHLATDDLLYLRRSLMRPGLFGPQDLLDYRGYCTHVERMRADLAYVDNWSMSLDLELTSKIAAIGVMRSVGSLRAGLRALEIVRQSCVNTISSLLESLGWAVWLGNSMQGAMSCHAGLYTLGLGTAPERAKLVRKTITFAERPSVAALSTPDRIPPGAYVPAQQPMEQIEIAS